MSENQSTNQEIINDILEIIKRTGKKYVNSNKVDLSYDITIDFKQKASFIDIASSGVSIPVNKTSLYYIINLTNKFVNARTLQYNLGTLVFNHKMELVSKALINNEQANSNKTLDLINIIYDDITNDLKDYRKSNNLGKAFSLTKTLIERIVAENKERERVAKINQQKLLNKQKQGRLPRTLKTNIKKLLKSDDLRNALVGTVDNPNLVQQPTVDNQNLIGKNSNISPNITPNITPITMPKVNQPVTSFFAEIWRNESYEILELNSRTNIKKFQEELNEKLKNGFRLTHVVSLNTKVLHYLKKL